VGADRDIGEVDRLATLEAENARLREALDDSRRAAGPDEGGASFLAMANSIDQMIWSTRADGFHDYFNQRWYDYTGVPEGSTDGEGWADLFHPDDREGLWNTWNNSLKTGDLYQIEYRLRHRSGAYRWVLGRAQPVRDEAGAILRWYGTCTDIHDLKTAQERLRTSEARSREVLEGMGEGYVLLSPELRLLDINAEGLRIDGRPKDEIVGRLLLEVWPESEHLPTVPAYRRALAEQRPQAIEYRHLSDVHDVWLEVRAYPVEAGLAVFYRDISERKRAEAEVLSARAHSDALAAEQTAILGQLGEGVIVADAQGRIVFVNEAAERLHGVKLLGVAPEDYSQTYHLLTEEGQPYPTPQLPLARAVLNGETVVDARWRIRRPDGSEVLAIGSAQPIRLPSGGKGGAILTIRDDTERFAAEQALRDSEARLRIVQAAGGIGSFDYDLQQDRAICSPEYFDLLGLPQGAPITRETWSERIHFEDRHEAVEALDRSIAHREAFDYEYRIVRADNGEVRWLSGRANVVFDAQDRPWRYVGGNIDVTARRTAEEAMREQSRTLETLNRTGEALAAELDLERVVQMVTDAGVSLTGAKFGAFFYNVAQAGELMMLYTLSGAARSDFEAFGMPRATAIFSPTFAGEGPIRSHDILTDPRYGKNAPHRGMPEGHLPVRSYLAVPVTSRSGEVIGGLFFGHPEPGRFAERHERLVVGIAAQAAVSIDNARLYQAVQGELAERVRAEERLRELNETLEQRVAAEVAQRGEAEEALRQMQKMETLGQLTGGVAHDFNNLLQIVTGNLEILQRNLPEDLVRLRRSADNAMRGAERAAVLTQRLLAFARRQPLEPKAINLNKLVAGMSELLHRTLGETYEVETVLAASLWHVDADPNQLENAIINLAVNARDAMPEGGKLTIETSNTYLDHGYAAQNTGVAPGQYVVICVSDTGSGMEAATLDRVFEPFFTTKDVGRGTGLGLSMVYGFVKQSGGHVKIYSEAGQGTTVKLYLPRRSGEVAEEELKAETLVPEGSREETILVCEDDDDVRTYSVEVLRELGYRVLEAHDGPSALRLLERQGGEVDLLFTDVVLPSGMMGDQLAEQARALRPGLKVLFTTGYARNAIVHQGRLDPGVELITKPFSYADLAARIRDLLDQRG
jgi:PAS domain S-box-containing protein